MNKKRLPFSREDYFKMLDEQLARPSVAPNPQIALQQYIERKKAEGNGKGKPLMGQK